MPKNKGLGGKKFRSTKKSYGLGTKNTILKDSEQNYAIVTDVLGSGRFRCHLDNGDKLLGILCGNMKKKKIWVNGGDLVLVSRRDYEKEKVDIIGKYNHDELDYLRGCEPCLEHLIKDDKPKEVDTEFFTQNELLVMDSVANDHAGDDDDGDDDDDDDDAGDDDGVNGGDHASDDHASDDIDNI